MIKKKIYYQKKNQFYLFNNFKATKILKKSKLNNNILKSNFIEKIISIF